MLALDQRIMIYKEVGPKIPLEIQKIRNKRLNRSSKKKTILLDTGKSLNEEVAREVLKNVNSIGKRFTE